MQKNGKGFGNFFLSLIHFASDYRKMELKWKSDLSCRGLASWIVLMALSIHIFNSVGHLIRAP